MTKENQPSRPIVTKEPDYDFLAPRSIRLFRDDSGRLRMTIQDDRSYPDVKVVRAFPLSEPYRYIAFLNEKDQVIGLVEDIDDLDQTSQQLALQSLQRHYFTPIIYRINKLKEEFGAVYCNVETDQGTREFVAKGMRDNLQELGDGRILLTDVDGGRYCVQDWRKLDLKSRRLLERLI